MKSGRYRCTLLTAALVAPLAWRCLAVAQDTQVRAAASADTVGVQEQFQLTITVSGGDSSDAEAPRLPRLQGFQVVAGPSISSQFQWINGRSTSSRSFIYILLPEKEGTFTIGPIEVRVGGKTLRTEPLSVRVTAQSQGRASALPRSRPFDPFQDEETSARARTSQEDLYVTAELDRASAYLGQQVTLSYHLYTQVSVTGIQLQENPPLTGFWVEDMEVERNQTGIRRTIDGREYLEYVVKKQALFPNATGRLQVPPSTFAISARGVGGFLGVFGQSETLYRRTKEVSLDVRPLPTQNRPPGFKNAVGKFNLTGNLDKTRVAAGEALTFRVQLSGAGNLKIAPDVELPPLSDLTVYSSKQSQSLRPFDGSRIGGDKTWEYVLVPLTAGPYTIPPLSYSYFDPEKEKYETVSIPAANFTVVPSAGDGRGGILSGMQKQNVTRLGSDINFIKLSPDAFRAPEDPPFRRTWFWVLVALPVMANVAGTLYRRRQLKDSGNFALARSRRARRLALARIKAAARAAKTDPRRLYDESSAALTGYLADRFSLPDIAVTADVLQRELAAGAVPGEVIREIVECLGECDFGRFVSASRDPARMQALTHRIRKVIDSLERAAG